MNIYALAMSFMLGVAALAFALALVFYAHARRRAPQPDEPRARPNLSPFHSGVRVQRIIDAWENAGSNPTHHRHMQNKLRGEWPVLALAIDLLVAENKR